MSRQEPEADKAESRPSFWPSPDEIKQSVRPKLSDVLGTGLITAASDDDPSGIATYAQAGRNTATASAGHSC